MELLSFEESPMSRRRKSLPVYLTPAESERLLAAARSPRNRCLFAVMLLAGLRSAEACALRIERIDLARGELLVFRGKGGRDRLLPISARLAPLLREQIGTRTEGFVFPGRKPDLPLSTRAVRHAVKTAARRAGISRPAGSPDISPHKLRHSFACRLVEKNVPLDAIRDLLGHSSLQVTSVYLHTNLDRLRAGVDLL